MSFLTVFILLNNHKKNDNQNRNVIDASRALFIKNIPHFASELPQLLPPLPPEISELEHARLLAEQIEAMLNRLVTFCLIDFG